MTVAFSIILQGTRLKIFPDEIAAYDQDIGINAPVYYTFNAGKSSFHKGKIKSR